MTTALIIIDHGSKRHESNAMLELFGNRYRQHVEVADAEEVAELWRG